MQKMCVNQACGTFGIEIAVVSTVKVCISCGHELRTIKDVAFAMDDVIANADLTNLFRSAKRKDK